MAPLVGPTTPYTSMLGHAGGCHEAKKQSLFIAYSNDLGVTLGVTNQ